MVHPQRLFATAAMPAMFLDAPSPGPDPTKWLHHPKEQFTSSGTPGRTLLMEAVLANDLAAVDALIPVSDVHAQDGQDFTALLHAAKQEPSTSTTCLKLLLDAGADPKHVDSVGITALMHATMAGHKQHVDHLWSVSDVARISNSGYTLLMLAAWKENNLDVMQQVAPVCDHHHQAHDGKKVLHAVSDPEMVRWLLEKGLGDPHHRDHDGNTALMRHAIHGTPDTLTLLLPMSDPLATNHAGETAFHRAVQAKKWRLAGALALAMPSTVVLPLLRACRGPSPRALERRVVDVERKALLSVMPSSTTARAPRPRL